ncbi:MAG: hypothetical protein NW237_10320 [Cyanobacteriota bacterium]|nr:hypothetical protein [Cyanobacteriota bacterium]
MEPKPPLRPLKPAVAPSTESVTSKGSSAMVGLAQPLAELSEAVVESSETRLQPIPPPSESMQYRAIGLVEGQYLPSPEQFTRGVLQTQDGSELDAVLLGRVMNIVRKHLEADKSYLWVVYPRTREKEQSLHVQIMGVWAPQEMGQSMPEGITATPTPDYFSIRGEIVFQSHDQGFVIVKIRQTSKKSPPQRDKPQSFKLRLEGSLPNKGVGDFWEFEVCRKGSQLEILSGKAIDRVPKPVPRPRKPQRKPPRPQLAGSEGYQPNKWGGRYPLPSPTPTERPSKPIKKKPPQS